MPIVKSESHPLKTEQDVVTARRLVRDQALRMKFSLVDQTKIVTAASELARNTIIHGSGGTMLMEEIVEGLRAGLRLTFEDKGKGIADLELAMRDGYSTGSGMGLGLSGSKRLMNEFQIESKPDQGTRVAVTKWK